MMKLVKKYIKGIILLELTANEKGKNNTNHTIVQIKLILIMHWYNYGSR